MQQLVLLFLQTGVMLIMTLHFTCIERKISSTIKESRNNMNIIANMNMISGVGLSTRQ